MTPEKVQGIVYYLISHQGRIKEKLRPFTEQRNKLLINNSLFSEEIVEQYKDLVTKTITDELTKDLGVTTEEARIVLEDLNMEEYLA